MADLLLPNLLTGNCSDCVCVRVSRFWNFYDTNNETKLLHADMVLIDEEVSTSDLLLNLPLQPLLSVVNQLLWAVYVAEPPKILGPGALIFVARQL